MNMFPMSEEPSPFCYLASWGADTSTTSVPDLARGDDRFQCAKVEATPRVVQVSCRQGFGGPPYLAWRRCSIVFDLLHGGLLFGPQHPGLDDLLAVVLIVVLRHLVLEARGGVFVASQCWRHGALLRGRSGAGSDRHYTRHEVNRNALHHLVP